MLFRYFIIKKWCDAPPITEALPAAVLHYMRGLLDYLYTHNKNYTKEQYYKIEILKTIVDNTEV